VPVARPRVRSLAGEEVHLASYDTLTAVDCPPARCRLRRRVEQLLATDGVDPVEVMPSRATFYRLVERLGTGRHKEVLDVDHVDVEVVVDGDPAPTPGRTFGSAPTRRSLAQRPDGPFGAVGAVRPVSGCRSTPPPWTCGSCSMTAPPTRSN